MVLQTGEQERLVLVHPAAQQHRQRRRRGAVRLPVQEPRDYEQTYHEEVERCPAVRERCRRRRARRPATSRRRTTRTAPSRSAGDGWVLVGDAWGFLDPLYSSGVLLALKSGEMAADAIVEGLAKGRHVGRAARQMGPEFNKGVDRMRRLVCEYYDGFSFGNFVRHYPGAAGHGHRPADRRSVHRPRGQGVAADGVALSAGQDADSDAWNQGAAPEAAPEKASELVLQKAGNP